MRHKAAQYYALAIAYAISSDKNTRFFDQSIHQLVNEHFWSEEDRIHAYGDRLLENPALFDAGINILIEQGLIIAITDDFGPTVFMKSADIDSKYSAWESEIDSVASKFALLGGHREAWLAAALSNINRSVELTEHETAAGTDEWTPIPIDRNGPQFIDMQEKLQVAFDTIRSDNGFAETFPSERNQVVFALEAGLKAIKENSSVHVEYIKAFIIDPLSSAIKRLKDSASGTAAQIAKGAIIKWLADSLGQSFPEWLRALF